MKESWEELTAYQCLLTSSLRNENHPAVITPGQSVTYQELLEESTILASRLKLFDIKKGDRVATIMDPSIDWVVVKYALSKLGAVIVPLNSKLITEEILHLLNKIKAKALFLIPGHKDQLLKNKMIGFFQSPNSNQEIFLDELQVVFTEKADTTTPLFVDSTLLFNTTSDKNSILDIEFEDSNANDLEAIIFTSGSTDHPKGVMLSHHNITGHAHYLSQLFDIKPNDRYLNLLPFYHIAGFAQSIRMNHFSGSTLYLPEDFTPASVCKIIENEKITASAGMPVTIFKLLNYAKDNNLDLSSLEKLHGISSDIHSRIKNETKIKFFSRMYGLTESAGLVSMHTIERNDNFPSDDFIGYPLPGVNVQIIDPQSRNVEPVNEIGEISFKGWNLFQGYYGDEENTKNSLTKDGFFRTGDRGFLDSAGGLHFSGRYKDMIKTGGENVSSLEIENFLFENIEEIRTTYVVGVPDANWGEVITAIIECKPNYGFSPEKCVEICKQGLANFKVPKYFLQKEHDDWPTNSTGKIDKKVLSEWAAEKIKEIENE